ncbi:hypothetical protein LBMAG53_18380 [Planctomycetota bacterium]|nr:hypothetical protein LBMAG53_18380 [Planctomycetota bacterium]
MSNPLPIALADLSTIADETWSTVINLPLEPGSAVPVGNVLISCVQIIYPTTTYVVAISAGPELAAKLAAGMLMMSPEEVGEQDRNDAFGEIANILGGGVKARLPEVGSMSMPVVISGTDVTVKHPKCVLALCACHTCAGSPLAISVYHQE